MIDSFAILAIRGKKWSSDVNLAGMAKSIGHGSLVPQPLPGPANSSLRGDLTHRGPSALVERSAGGLVRTLSASGSTFSPASSVAQDQHQHLHQHQRHHYQHRVIPLARPQPQTAPAAAGSVDTARATSRRGSRSCCSAGRQTLRRPMVVAPSVSVTVHPGYGRSCTGTQLGSSRAGHTCPT